MFPHSPWSNCIVENTPLRWCVCVYHIWIDVKLLIFCISEFIRLPSFHDNRSRGTIHVLCAMVPTKRPQYMRISRLITVTYLLFYFPIWHRAKLRTLPKTFLIFFLTGAIARLSMHAFISTGTIARQFQQEPSLDFSLFCSPIEGPCSLTAICNFLIFPRYFDISVRTEFSGLSMRTEHQLLSINLHWNLLGSDLLFVVFCTPGTLHIRSREVVLIQVCAAIAVLLFGVWLIPSSISAMSEWCVVCT